MDKLKYRIPVSIVLFSVIGYLIGIYLIYNNPERTGNFNFFNKTLFVIFIPASNLAGFLCEYILLKLNKILPWKKFMFARFTVGYLVSFVISAITILLVNVIFYKTNLNLNFQNKFSEPHLQELFKLLVIITFILFVYNLLHLTLYSYSDYFINSLKIKKMKREQMDLHIQALQNQLTPHYLFNNLNSISSLLQKDKNLTDKYIRSFVQTSKFILDNSRNILITLAQELEFVKSYQFLMEVRFSDMFLIEVDIPESLKNWYLPPLSLQLLIENAIKHNTLNSGNLLRIKIYTDGKNNLVIENNLTETAEPKNLGNLNVLTEKENESTKVGLQNLKSRYSYLTDKVVITEKSDNFSVKIPLLNTNRSIYETKIA